MKLLILILSLLFIPVVAVTQDTVQIHSWQPDSIESYTPPPFYGMWWAQISDCAKLAGDMERIKWWRAIEVGKDSLIDRKMSFSCPLVGWCDGWSNSRKGYHDIYIAYNRIYEERLIKHEMLHDLLGEQNLVSPAHHQLFTTCKVL